MTEGRKEGLPCVPSVFFDCTRVPIVFLRFLIPVGLFSFFSALPLRPVCRTPLPSGWAACCAGSGWARTTHREKAAWTWRGEEYTPHTHVVGECEIYMEGRDVLEETKNLDEGGMEEFGGLESREKTIAILGDRW